MAAHHFSSLPFFIPLLPCSFAQFPRHLIPRRISWSARRLLRTISGLCSAARAKSAPSRCAPPSRNGDGDDDDGTDPVTVVKTVVKTQHPVTHIVTQTARPHTVTRSVATPVTVSVTRSVSVTHASPVIIIVPTGASSGFTIHPTPSALPPTSAAYLPMPSAPAPPYGSPSPSPSDPVEYQPSSDLPTSTAPPYYGPGASAPPSLLVPMPAPTTLSTIVAPPPSWISPSSVVTDWNGQVQPTQAPWPAWNGTTVNPFPAGQR
ncbi:hypothetical protein HIM_07124 [Hirsutella minnesotensis 3608]|uniref:Uncharacterized protein n=1 Tax=Hirsutella minnesotensis 3608 TaxID=1043627 RepID=A0A0F7ZTR4_9HYPO|nr:hypothetical protein HIM_07124 [Hirsutella minnesotensis 3608]